MKVLLTMVVFPALGSLGYQDEKKGNKVLLSFSRHAFNGGGNAPEDFRISHARTHQSQLT